MRERHFQLGGTAEFDCLEKSNCQETSAAGPPRALSGFDTVLDLDE